MRTQKLINIKSVATLKLRRKARTSDVGTPVSDFFSLFLNKEINYVSQRIVYIIPTFVFLLSVLFFFKDNSMRLCWCDRVKIFSVLRCWTQASEFPQISRTSLESLAGRETSTATSPLHPTNQRCWFHASHESAHSAGISCSSLQAL